MNSTLYDESYFQEMRGAKTGEGLYSSFVALIDDLPASISVLDLGCGRGEMVERLAQRAETKVYGLDFSSAAVQVTRAKVPRDVANNVVHGSATDSSLFPAEFFDVIFLMDVVEHLSPQALVQAFQNVRLWLKPEGRVVVHTFPTLGPHRIYQALLLLTGKRQELQRLNAIHCNVQTRRSLSRTLLQAGLVPTRIWLRNDFTRTSSAFQRLPEGAVKNVLAFLLDRILGHRSLRKVFELIGLAEYACPSIYCYASRQP